MTTGRQTSASGGACDGLPLNPSLVLRPLMGNWSGQVLAAAMKLDLLGGPDGVTADEIAEDRCWANRELIQALLAALEGLGFLRSDGRTYSRSDVSRAYLSRASDFDLRNTFKVFVDDGAYLVRRIESALRNSYDEVPYICSAELSTGMEALSIPVATAIADETTLRAPHAGRFLDLGGGSGIYSRRLSKTFRHAKFLQVDTSEANAAARQLADRDGISSRFATVDGNLPDCLPKLPQADIVLCCHLLHYFRRDRYGEILKAIAALRPKLLVVADFTQLPSQSPGAFRELFDVVLRSQVRGGGIPDLESLLDAAHSAGIGDPQVISLDPRPSNLFLWQID